MDFFEIIDNLRVSQDLQHLCGFIFSRPLLKGTSLIITAILVWLWRKRHNSRMSKEATLIFSSNSELADSDAGTDEDTCIPESRVKIPVRGNNAFRIRQMYAAMKLGKYVAPPSGSAPRK